MEKKITQLNQEIFEKSNLNQALVDSINEVKKLDDLKDELNLELTQFKTGGEIWGSYLDLMQIHYDCFVEDKIFKNPRDYLKSKGVFGENSIGISVSGKYHKKLDIHIEKSSLIIYLNFILKYDSLDPSDL